jgi:hypothetical protein
VALKVDLNRLDGRAALSGLRSANVRINGSEASVELMLSDDHEIEVYFPAPQDQDDDRWVQSISDVLCHLAEMDNTVQRISAEQCARSGYDSINYEGYLAYITLAGHDSVVLHYDGVVNTEWDEPFVRVYGEWRAVNTA